MKNRKAFTLLEIMIAVVIIGLLAALALPTFQAIRTSAQKKAITNNLRHLASAADQYFLTTGHSTVSSDQLVGAGTDAYVREFSPVASETYPETISTTDGELVATDSAIGNVAIRF